MCLQGRAVNPAPLWRVSSLQLCLAIARLLQGRRHQRALGLRFICGTGNAPTYEKPGCTVGARLPVSHPDSLSVSVIFDQSCRRSQRMWWTDASLSPWCRCLCSVRSLTKKLTGRYWFSLFRDSLYTWQPKWRHSPVFWHVIRVCILELQPAKRIPFK